MTSRRLKSLQRQMDNAETYAEWARFAQAHDRASGAARWAQTERSRRFDYQAIRRRLDQLRTLRGAGDNSGLLFTLNEGIHGNMGGMGSSKLYRVAQFGTKALVTEYVTEINTALNYLASPEVDDITPEEKLDFFRRASQCYGRSALMMSGSGTLLHFHVGVVRALWTEGLLPSVLSGSSGGAVVAAIVATHANDELSKLFQPDFLLSEVRQESSVWQRLSTIKPTAIPAPKVRAVFERLIPDITFQEAAERTGIQLNVSVAPAETHQSSRLLNAVASPNVYIHDALMATTAVPGIYPPVMLMARNMRGERQPYLPRRKWVDGAVSDDLPAKRLARLYGVNHTVVSQTNPIALPFVRNNNRDPGVLSPYRHAAQQTAREWFNANLDALRGPLSRIPKIERPASMLRAVINQRYTGDINIIPDYRLVDPRKLLALRTEQEVMAMIKLGERATWSKLEMIRLQTRIGGTLDRILEDMERTAEPLNRMRA